MIPGRGGRGGRSALVLWPVMSLAGARPRPQSEGQPAALSHFHSCRDQGRLQGGERPPAESGRGELEGQHFPPPSAGRHLSHSGSQVRDSPAHAPAEDTTVHSSVLFFRQFQAGSNTSSAPTQRGMRTQTSTEVHIGDKAWKTYRPEPTFQKLECAVK